LEEALAGISFFGNLHLPNTLLGLLVTLDVLYGDLGFAILADDQRLPLFAQLP